MTMMCDPTTKDPQPYYQRDNHARSLTAVEDDGNYDLHNNRTLKIVACTLHNSQQDPHDVGSKNLEDLKLF